MNTRFFLRVIPSVDRNSGKKAKNRSPIVVHLMFDKCGIESPGSRKPKPNISYFRFMLLDGRLLHLGERGRHGSNLRQMTLP